MRISIFSGLLLFQTGHRDVQSSKNFSCSYKKAKFPICLEVAFGPRPWESQRALRHSSEFPDIWTSPWPGSKDPLSALGPKTCSPQGAAAPQATLSCSELSLLGRLTSAALATSNACSLSVTRGHSASPRQEPDCGGLSVFVETGPGETASQARLPGMCTRVLCRRLCQQAQETGWKGWEEAQVWTSSPSNTPSGKESQGTVPGQRSLLC